MHGSKFWLLFQFDTLELFVPTNPALQNNLGIRLIWVEKKKIDGRQQWKQVSWVRIPHKLCAFAIFHFGFQHVMEQRIVKMWQQATVV